jgi:hypothetical protein
MRDQPEDIKMRFMPEQDKSQLKIWATELAEMMGFSPQDYEAILQRLIKAYNLGGINAVE